jgi:hypothetical protein
MSMLDKYKEMKASWEDKIALANTLPETYKDQKEALISNAKSMISMLDQRISIEEAKKAEAESVEYKALEKFGKNLPLSLLQELNTIYNDGTLTAEQKELLICGKGGCMPAE